jgi:hypothetical protein
MNRSLVLHLCFFLSKALLSKRPKVEWHFSATLFNLMQSPFSFLPFLSCFSSFPASHCTESNALKIQWHPSARDALGVSPLRSHPWQRWALPRHSSARSAMRRCIFNAKRGQRHPRWNKCITKGGPLKMQCHFQWHSYGTSCEAGQRHRSCNKWNK